MRYWVLALALGLLTVWPVGVVLGNAVDPTALLEADPSMRTTPAESRSMGDGFMDHGRAVSAAQRRGLVSTANPAGESVVLVWLAGDSILEINVESGEYQEHPNPHFGDEPFASLLSSDEIYYTGGGGHFVRFDPKAEDREIEHLGEFEGRHIYSMIEDDEGVIWAAISTNAGLVRYDPRTGELHDYGSVYEADRRVGARFLASDDRGWIYKSIAEPGQILIVDPETGESTAVLDEHERGPSFPRLWRGTDGKVYAPGGNGQWIELYDGEATRLNFVPDFTREYGTYKSPMRAHFTSGTQGLMHRDLPNGERVKDIDLLHAVLLLEDPNTGETRELEFAYEGGQRAYLVSMVTTSMGTVAGGTMYPGRFFSYDPESDEWTRGEIYGQWNTVTASEDGMAYVGIYTRGKILEWDFSRDWVKTEPENPDSNPLSLDATQAHPHIWRPTDILAYPGGRHVILAGVSNRAEPGGGLSFWDRRTRTAEILTHEDLVRYHNSVSLAPLPGNQLLVGTTIMQWGGRQRAEGDAELYVLDIESKEIQWQQEIEGTSGIRDMWAAPDGRVFILENREPGWRVDRHRMLVFDPAEMDLVAEIEVPEYFGNPCRLQGSQFFAPTSDGRVFLLFADAIVELDTDTHELVKRARPPAQITGGGTYLDGRLYFRTGRARLASWEVPHD